MKKKSLKTRNFWKKSEIIEVKKENKKQKETKRERGGMKLKSRQSTRINKKLEEEQSEGNGGRRKTLPKTFLSFSLIDYLFLCQAVCPFVYYSILTHVLKCLKSNTNCTTLVPQTPNLISTRGHPQIILRWNSLTIYIYI